VFGSLTSFPIAVILLQVLSMNAAGLVARLHAQIAADAAALVAIHEGEDAARALADANGAELIQIEWLNDFHTYVEVRVRNENRESVSTAALT
jgi:hypothetical protein